MISSKAKSAIHKLICERAYEIEEKLSEDNFFLARMAGVRPEKVSEVALNCAVKELKDKFKKS